MKYTVDIFRASWQIRTNVKVDSRVVCQGPYPNDEASGPVLMVALLNAVRADDDNGVKQAMGEWAK